jgi:PAS domain S-box-containing protein
MKNHKQILKDVAVGLALLAIYVVAGKLGLKLAFVNESATAIWPPTGIAIAALLVLGYRFWPAILLGAFLVNFTTSGGVFTSLGIALGNTLESLLAVYLVNRFASGKQVFDRASNIFKFAFFAGIIATALSATIGGTTLVLGGLANSSHFSSIWLTWWLGDMGGALIVAPLLVLYSSTKFSRWSIKKIFEGLVFLVSLFFVGQTVFGDLSFFGIGKYPLDFLFIPLLLWVAFRFGRKETATAIVILSGIAAWGTLHGFGPFALASQNESLLLLQSFMGIIGITNMAVAAVISEREELEDSLIEYGEQIEENKVKAEALLASIGEGVIATDENGKIIVVNSAFEDLLGWKSREVIGRGILDVVFMEDEDKKEVTENHRPLNLAFSSGKTVAVTHYLLRKDKTRFPAAITAAPIILNGKTMGAIKIFRDITREKQIDKAKTEFVSLASHQLRTPLTIIKWHSSRLLSSWDDNSLNKDQQKKYIEEIQYTNQRMIELINAILNVSKIDLGNLAIEPENVQITKITDEVLKDLNMQLKEKSLTVHKKYSTYLPSLNVDPKLMSIVIQNLLTNAIKYTPVGGNIECSVDLHNNGILITVSDNGCGISKEDYGRIFTKFFRTETARNIDPAGNGLGMYIVQAIVKEAGGTVWFESEVGKGTSFHVIIPLIGMKKKQGVKGLVAETYNPS